MTKTDIHRADGTPAETIPLFLNVASEGGLSRLPARGEDGMRCPLKGWMGTVAGGKIE